MNTRLFIFFLLLLPTWTLAERTDQQVAEILRAQGEAAKKNAHLYYDEIFDEKGALRPHYRDIYPQILKRSKADLKEIRRLTVTDFSKDNALGPVARIFTKEENEQLMRGTQQRGEALLMFLQDYYSGERTYDKAGVIPHEVVERIVKRSGESGYVGRVDPKLISFMYGPDVIRDSEGIFRVLEDNSNYLGMQGDLVKAREILWNRFPEYPAVMGEEKLPDPMRFYRDLVKHYRAQMKNPKEKMVFFSVPPFPDKEDFRLEKIWEELGVEAVTPYTRDPKIVKRADGMYLERKVGNKTKLEKIGFVLMNSEYGCLDKTYAPAWHQCLLHEARDALALEGKDALKKDVRKKFQAALEPRPGTGLPNFGELDRLLYEEHWVAEIRRGQVHGIIDAVMKGQVLTNNSPGTEFTNDKEFNMYVEDLIRHYKKEEPILRNIPTRRLYVLDKKGRRVLDSVVFKDLEKNMDAFVVKVTDGRGGDGVWVGPKLSKKERRKLLKRLKADTSREVIVQAYHHPSVMAGDIVDVRVFAQLDDSGSVVSRVSATRAVGMEGDGKVNLSAGVAHEAAVIERDVRCGTIYRALAPKRPK